MINDKIAPPKVRHNDFREDTKNFRAVLSEFTKQMEEMFRRHQQAGKIGWDDPALLLDMRKALVTNIKEGMLERKDQELDIALLSMFVWFCRLEEEKRHAILAEWG